MIRDETEVQWNMRLPLWVKQALEIHAVKENETVKETMKMLAQSVQSLDGELTPEIRYKDDVEYINGEWLEIYKRYYSQAQQEELINLHIQQIRQHYPHLLPELESRA